jgi:16S rRNA (adenine1518-N6/adenine1519-N6)-dimethyltransferase
MAAYHAKKRLGQNFLHSQTIIEQIVALLEQPEQLPIIEIGPGRAALTLPLARSGSPMIAVEFDRDLVGYLTKILKGYPNVELRHQDFLTFEPELARFRLIGNIPYNLTSPVIEWCLRYADRIDRVVLMVQQELAHRLAAVPGTKAWSPLSIFAQLRFDIKLAFDVPSSAFRPAPSVVSSVLTMVPKVAVPIANRKAFERVVAAAFAQRRKTLVNNLTPSLFSESDQLREILETLQVSAKARAEELSIERFLELTEHLTARNLV